MIQLCVTTCPALVPRTVLHSGEYYLFESDSEDEEELQSEEQKPQKLTACQVRPTKHADTLFFSEKYSVATQGAIEKTKVQHH